MFRNCSLFPAAMMFALIASTILGTLSARAGTPVYVGDAKADLVSMHEIRSRDLE